MQLKCVYGRCLVCNGMQAAAGGGQDEAVRLTVRIQASEEMEEDEKKTYIV